MLERLPAVVAMAEAAGRLIVEHWGKVSGERKRDQSLVTVADRASEALIRRELERQFPGEAIVGEEYGVTGDTRRVWFVDPLDGTTNFVHRLPLWCVAIGLLDGPEAVLGVVHQPLLGLTWTGVAGHGAHLNGQPLAPWPGAEPFTATDPVVCAEEIVHDGLGQRVPGKLRMLGSSVLQLAWVASGSARAGIWHRGDYGWDLVAGAAICRAAGVSVETYAGETPDLSVLANAQPMPWSLLVAPPATMPLLRAALLGAGA